MKTKDLIKSIKLSTDLIAIFKEYINLLDEYFIDDKNKQEHFELYDMYKILQQDIESLKNDYDF